MAECQTCGKPLSRVEGRPGRASVYCSPACRQRAYRERSAPTADPVPELIADIEGKVKALLPDQPIPFYTEVNALSGSVGRLRRIARDAYAAAMAEPVENVTEEPVTQSRFAALVEPHRRELHVHCYRMLASYDDAEDLVQETFLRAWRRRDSFEGRSTFRAWLYRIATNACLDFLRQHSRTPGTYPRLPGFEHGEAASPARIPWLQAYPDEMLPEVADQEPSPEAAAVGRETMELVFLAAIQHLPPRQRAVLVMRDVLGWPASDTAEQLDMTVAAVNSALQRARPALREWLPRHRLDWTRPALTSAEERHPGPVHVGRGQHRPGRDGRPAQHRGQVDHAAQPDVVHRPGRDPHLHPAHVRCGLACLFRPVATPFDQGERPAGRGGLRAAAGHRRLPGAVAGRAAGGGRPDRRDHHVRAARVAGVRVATQVVGR
jgi:RNA polymerase sigma-70 factor (ECF subfamily)